MSVTAVQAEIRRWFEALNAPPKRLLVAVSGGGDSLALLHALSVASRDTNIRVSAATVDHGLRPAAADEADYVSKLCGVMNIPHYILTVNWAVGEVPSQSRARKHRYRLLADCANTIGATMVVTGHTNDDQAETVLMRRQAGSGWWGLAGMSDLSIYPLWPEGERLQLARPVLALSRGELRSYLNDVSLEWIDDPSNDNTRFERVRVRQHLAEDAALKRSLLETSTQSRLRRAEFSDWFTCWSDQNLGWLPGGGLQLSFMSFQTLNAEQRYRVFQHVLPCISGRTAMPRSETLQNALAELSVAEGDHSRTISGCVITKREDTITVCAEIADPARKQALTDGLIWNGRVKLQCPDLDLTGLSVTAWDERPVPKALNLAQNLPFSIRKALPVIVNGRNEIVSVPHFEPENGILASDLAAVRLRNWLNPKTVQFREESHTEESFSR